MSKKLITTQNKNRIFHTIDNPELRTEFENTRQSFDRPFVNNRETKDISYMNLLNEKNQKKEKRINKIKNRSKLIRT